MCKSAITFYSVSLIKPSVISMLAFHCTHPCHADTDRWPLVPSLRIAIKLPAHLFYVCRQLNHFQITATSRASASFLASHSALTTRRGTWNNLQSIRRLSLCTNNGDTIQYKYEYYSGISPVEFRRHSRQLRVN